MLIEMKDLLDRIEEKVRHVRTQEGVRKYNLPIGSPIVARAKAIKTKKVRAKPIERSVELDAVRVNDGASQYDRYGFRWGKPNAYDQQNGYAELGRHKSGHNVAVRKFSGGFYGVLMRNGKVTDGPTVKTSAAAKKWIRDAIKEDQKAEVRRIDRDYLNFYEANDGRYGRDWTRGDEDPDLLKMLESDDAQVRLNARRELAQMDSDDIGISVITDNPNGRNMSVAVHERINTMMRAYETWYPGFIYYTPVFRMNTDRKTVTSGHGDVIAYNRHVQHVVQTIGRDDEPAKRAEQKVGADGIERFWDYGEVNLVEDRIYGEAFQPREVALLAKRQTDGGFYSNDLITVAKKNEIHPSLAFIDHTIHHEIAHTMMRPLLGQFTSDTIDDGWEADRKKYHDRFFAVLEKHGLMEDASVPGHPNMKLKVFNSDRVEPHVSKYGATTIHEMGAEAWAAYMLSDSPTEVQYELAQVMEESFLDYMRRNDA